MISQIQADILAALSKKHALPLQGIAARMDYHGNMEQFKSAVNDLVRQGYMVKTKKGKYTDLSSLGLCRAKIVTQLKEYAFARPEGGERDIFIPTKHLGGAIAGDTVLVRLGARSGKVEQVVELGPRGFSGKVVMGRRGPKVEVGGGIRFALPAVGLEVHEGDKVRGVLVNLSDGRLAAQVEKSYGSADSARVCADCIVDAAGIPTVFSADALEQAGRISGASISQKELTGRLDLREEPIFTIDGADAKDLDDAISVKRTPGGWELGVHIADVSHYVTAGSPLDQDAKLRGTSVYFADRVIPMLPKELSNGICSLNAGEDRLTFSALLQVDARGNLQGYEFQKSVIRSRVKGVYSEVNQLLDGTAGAGLKEKYRDVLEELPQMEALTNTVQRQSERRGALELETDEPKIVLGPDGRACDVLPRARGKAERMIESFMILANEAAAALAQSAGIPFVYRVHGQPSSERLEQLKQAVNLMGFDSRRIKAGCRSADLQTLLRAARGTKYAPLLSDQVLRSMAKAEYSTVEIGHFGLALQNYAHFTSPIRRYPDTSIHRILTDLCTGVSPDELHRKYGAFAEESARLSTDTEVRAVAAERECEACYLAEYMRDFVGQEFDGCIASAVNHGLYVKLENTVEGLVRADSLRGLSFDGAFSFAGGGQKLTVGDRVRVKLLRADVSSGQVDFELVSQI